MSVRQDKVQVSVVVDGKQGINELGQLEMRASDLRKSMQGLKKDSAEYIALSKEYDTVKGRMGELREELGVTGMTMKQMRTYARELQQEMENAATRGTARYDELKDKLQEVNGAMARQKEEVKGASGFWSKISTEVKQFGMLAIGALGFQFVGEQISNLISKGKKLSDELADVAKTTGMTKNEVRELNSELSHVDTRTGTSELRKIAAVAGQLGQAKKDILDFTLATDKLVVSLGDEFQGGAEEVTKAMGGLRNIFSDIKSDKVDQDMLHIGNAINVLASNGAATGPVVADFANRIGGVGVTMGLTSGQVLGLSATMQELNISTERGSTAVVKILQKMASEPEKFAKVAGLSVKEFSRLVDTDLFAAFSKVTEGAGKTGSQATALAHLLDELGVDGAGASEVLAKLGGNTELLQQKVKLAGDSLHSTNSIMQEFSTKNDNLAGKLEKLTKWFAGNFTNSSFNSFLEGAVDGLSRLVGLTNKADELTNAFREQKEVVAGLEKTTLPLIDRYEELSGKANRNTQEQTELDGIIEQLAKTVPTAVTEFDKYGKALGINSGHARDFVTQQKEMLKIQNAEVIKVNTEELLKLEAAIKRATEALKADKNGDRWKEVQHQVKTAGGEFDYVTERVLLTNREVAELSKLLGKLQQEASGRRGILAEATGEKTIEQIKAEQDAIWQERANFWFKTKKGLEDAGAAQLGLLQEIDAKIKAYTEQRDAARSAAEITRLTALIKEQEELRARLLGEFKNKQEEKDAKAREKEHAALLKSLEGLRKLAYSEQAKLRALDDDKDQQALNQLDAHYDEMLATAREYSQNTKLTVEERRLAMQAIDLLYDTKEEARENLKRQQRERRAAEDLKFMNQQEMDKINLRILLAKRNEKDDPEEYEAALIAKVEKERDIELQNTKLTQEQRAIIIQNAEDKINAIHASAIDKRKKDDERALREFLQSAQQTGEMYFGWLAKQSQNAQQHAENDKDRRLKTLEAEYKAGRISKERYEATKAGIDEQYHEKQSALKREQAENEKNAALFNAVIQGALAIQRALAEGGPYLGPALASIIGAMTVLNVEAISSEPLPAFVEGGSTDGQFTRAQALQLPHQNLSEHPGGMLRGDAFLATVNERGEEYFVPHDLLEQPAVARSVAIIEAIRTGRSGGSAMPAFEEGGSTTGRAARGAGLVGGGATMSEATGLQMLAELSILRQMWQQGTVLRAEVVHEQLAESEALLTKIYSEASF